MWEHKRIKFCLSVIMLLFSVLGLTAADFYWIGGSGSFNDAAHWSFTSGGVSCGQTPGANDDVYFDANSITSNKTKITFPVSTSIRSLVVLESQAEFEFDNVPGAHLEIKGSIKTAEATKFNYTGTLEFNSNLVNNQLWFGASQLNCEIIFNGNGSWKPDFLFGANQLKVVHNSGTLILSGTGVKCREFISNGGTVQLNTALIRAYDYFEIKQQSTLSVTKGWIQAPISNSAKYKAPGISPSQNLKIANIAMACDFQDMVVATFTTCAPGCFGEASISFTGCNFPPYVAEWYDGNGNLVRTDSNIVASPYTADSLCCSANSYGVVFYDNTGNNVDISQVSVTCPSGPLIIRQVTAPTCFDTCDGQIRLTISGSYPAFTVAYSPLPNPNLVPQPYPKSGVLFRDTAFNVCANTFTLTVTNSIGCVTTQTFTVNQPLPVTTTSTITPVNCFGTSTGAITVAASGGVGPYTFNWNPPAGQTGNTVSNLPIGTYSASILDANGCPGSYSGTITQPPDITFTTSSVNPICGDVCSGTATMSAVTGGTPPYTFSWAPLGTTFSSGANSSTATSLCPGQTYTVTVTDANGCTKTATYNITGPAPVVGTNTVTNVSCNLGTNGQAQGGASGGTNAGFTFCWTGPTGFLGCVNPVTGLSAGTYTMVVTDNAGCDDTTTFTVTEPTAITSTLTPTFPVCANVCDGTITTAVAGGTPNYSFTWTSDNGTTPTGQNPVNVCTGNYTVTITDANLCSITNTVSINQPPPIVFNLTTTSPSCFGFSDGSANVTASGGTGSVTAQWADCAACTFPRTNMAAGTYTVIATDGVACSDTFIFTLTQPTQLVASVTTTSLTCANTCNGTITSTVSGGTPSYNYTWDGVAGGNAVITGQCAGAHTLLVTDANGCNVTVNTSIASPPPLVASATSNNPACFNQFTGTANGSATGGVGTYDFFWSPLGSTAANITNLGAGTYTLTVTDDNNCQDTTTVTITTPPALSVSATSTDVTCAGACNGTATAIVNGGTPGYTVSWTGGGSGLNIVNLCPGTYNVNVTDANGCTASSAVNITQPTVLSVSVSNVTTSCPGNCSGGALATGNGGVPNYSYSWAPGGQTGDTPTNLCPGTNTVTVTDANGCTSSTTFSVVASLSVTITTSGTALDCAGDCDGIAMANAVGGTGGVNYNWAPSGQTSSTASGLCAGTHTVSVSDANGCTNTATVTFTAPPALVVTPSSTSESCFGQCNGSVSVAVAGGTNPVTVVWNPGNITATSMNNLCAGTYTYTATDANGCSVTDSVTVGSASVLTVTSAATNPSACTSADGCITINPSGGTSPYSFNWSNPAGQTTQTVCGLSDGNYTVTVSDLNGCSSTVQVALSDPFGPTATVTVVNDSCFGSCNGSATINATGSGAVTITWPTPPGTVGPTATGLCADTFNVSMTDATGCTTFATVVITEPAEIEDAIIVTNATCNASCNGSIDPGITGGTAPYTFAWTPSGSGSPATNLCAGSYTLTATDAMGCSATFGPYVVTEPPAIAITVTSTQISCFGICNGSASASASGGTAPLTISWAGPNGFTSPTTSIVNLCAGTYTVTVLDGNGCTQTDTVVIAEPNQLNATLTATNALCNGQCNGSATLVTTGGTGAISFSWPPSTGTGSTVSNLCAGSYTATAQDANGCQDTVHFTITQPVALAVADTFTSPTCFGGNNGSAAVTVSGGTPNYSYSWSPNINVTPSASNLTAGTYTVNITDANGCAITSNITITQPTPVQGNYSSTSVSCSQPCSGSITANPSGGVGPYSVSITGNSFTNLCAGSYTVNVTDANGCPNSSVIAISAPPALTAATSVNPSNCSVPCAGSILITPTSGTSPYSYLWLSGSITGNTTNNPSGLCAGIYSVQVTDASSCIDTFSVAISDANAADSVAMTVNNPSCENFCDGNVTITQVFNGTPPFDYQWSPIPDTTLSVSNLCDGTYFVTITDVNNCQFIPSVTLTEPSSITAVASVTQATCNGVCNGAISLTPAGGTAPYTYAWTSSTGFTGTGASISNLCAGTYSVVITDSNNCTSTLTFTITNNQAILGNASSTNSTCNSGCDGTAIINNVSGGTPPYILSWSDPLGQSTPIATNLCPGTYSLTITDAAGCSETFTAPVITEPTAVTANATVTDASCGVCNGQISLAPSGGAGAYTYVWSNTQTTSSVSNVCAGVYMVDITDAAGCVTQHSVAVSSTNAPSLAVTPVDVTCGNLSNGSASATASGGTPPYTFNWLPGGQVGPSVSGLSAGTYFVQVQDANNCVSSQSFTIAATSSISLTQSSLQPTCGQCDGTLGVAATGGSGTYTFNWSNGGATNSITNICAGVYTVSVTDNAGCSSQAVYALSNAGAPVITVNADSADCNGAANGAASVSVLGGTSPYTYLWSDGTTGTSVSNLAAGSYGVTVTDAAGCVAAAGFDIEEPSQLSLSLNAFFLPSCANVCNGSMTAIPSGGTLPYSYVWSNGDLTATATNLCAGAYSIVVTDANGCTATQNTTLNNNPSLIAGNPTVVDPACGACDGTITLAPSGGTSPYTYVWSTTATTPTLTNVCAGVYQVNITDSSGCTTPVYVNVSNAGAPAITLTSTPQTCSSVNDGTASSTVTGGTVPYAYFWVVGGETSSSLTGQQPGTYTLQVADAMNCIATASVNIAAASSIVANPIVTTPGCGLSNGAISLNPSGGSGSGYTFNWCCSLPATATQTNLNAGVYTVDITDGAGCTETINIPVTNGTVPLVSVDVDSVLCNGGTTGSASVTISGGSGSYSIDWSSSTGTGITESNLAAGSYFVTVVDNVSGCSTSALFDIEEPDTLILSLNSQQQPACSLAANGVLTAIPSGGSLPYSYLWFPGGQNTAAITNLSTGSFTVQVTDANGCTRTQTSVLNNAVNIANLNASVSGPSCGLCNGSITLNPTGGNAPFSFVWSSTDTTQNIANVCPGVYQVLVTDSIGCQQTVSIAVSNSSGINSVSQTITPETCFNSCNGAATITPVGGTAPYSYSWVNLPDTTSTVSNLCAGNYFVQITDATGCVFTWPVDIYSPAQVLITPIVGSPNCGATNGSIALQTTGGLPPYTYTWLPPVSTSSVATNLGAGNYQVTVNDGSGCSQNFIFALNNVNGPLVTANVTQPLCAGNCNGSVALSVSGGTAPYNFAWDNGSLTDSIGGLCSDTVFVTVTDAAGCVAAASYVVTSPDPLQFSLPVVNNVLCFGDSNASIIAVPSGGTLGFTYSWTPASAGSGPAAMNLPAGAYAVTITDANGCTLTQSDTITEPPLLVVSGLVTDASCNTVPDGAIDLTVVGGTPAYSYSWSNADTTQDLLNIIAGAYSVTVTDANGCTDTAGFNVNATVFVVASTGADTTICYSPTVLLDASATTGEAGLTWYNSSMTPIGTTDTLTAALNVGVNTFYVIAVNGACSDSDTIVITNSAIPIVDAGPYQTVLMFNSVTIGGNPTGSFGSTYQWTPGATLSDSTISNPLANPTETTTYTVTVTTAQGCTATDTVTVRVLPQVIFPNGFTPNGDGKNDTWIIDNITLFPECEVEVYNRWGEQLFYSKGYTTPWDGTYKGKALPVGTYYYAIKLNHELFPEPYTGPITILR